MEEEKRINTAGAAKDRLREFCRAVGMHFRRQGDKTQQQQQQRRRRRRWWRGRKSALMRKRTGARGRKVPQDVSRG